MNESQKDLYSWFLGPKGENADIFEKLILDVLRDCVFWRRNFHPEDEVIITAKVKQDPSFRASVDKLEQELIIMLGNLKKDIPFYSPRYIGHMLGDQLLPALVGYFAGMIHNPNNVTHEASPITTKYEMEVARDIAKMVGYQTKKNDQFLTWGHITSGGTIANFEALWVARNLKYFPFAAQATVRKLGVSLELTRGKTKLEDMQQRDIIFRLTPDEILQIRNKLYEYRNLPGFNEALKESEFSEIGAVRFHEKFKLQPGKVLVPHTAHYSCAKVVEALGLGRDSIVHIPVDKYFRMDINKLQETLEKWEENVPIIALVSVAGTTEEGAVDQIHRIVALQIKFAEKLNFFHHCDAAWGGYMRTLFYDKQGKHITHSGEISHIANWPSQDIFESFEAMKYSDSVTVDPHKLGYIPYPCGTIVFRNRAVKDLISSDAPYIFGGGEAYIGKHILEGSKPGAAAAACWLAHRVVPLNQGGYGKIIGASLQSAFELNLKLSKDLTQKLKEYGITLHMLTDLPDTNVLCFLVNKQDNTSLEKMNQYNDFLSRQLRFNPEKSIHEHEFIVSGTELTWQNYSQCMETHLVDLGIEDPLSQFQQEKKIIILRCTVMTPWLSVARKSNGGVDYFNKFAETLWKATILSIYRDVKFMKEIRDKAEKYGQDWFVLWNNAYVAARNLKSEGMDNKGICKILNEAHDTEFGVEDLTGIL